MSTSASEPHDYEAPVVYDLGSVVSATRGSCEGSNDAIGQGYP